MRSPAGARRFLDVYDTQMADPMSARRMHRAGHHFASTSPGSLRDLMEQYASGQGLHPRLDQEIRAYEVVSLGERAAEGEHRHASLARHRGPAAGHVAVASEMRRAQNIQAFNAAARRGDGDTFLESYRQRKSILQKDKARSARLVRKRVSTKLFYMQV